MSLAEKIENTKVNTGEIVLFYLAQAGFCIKTAENKIIIIDAYLSDAAERLFNFRRMIPAMIRGEELHPDLYLSTHSHIDHLDVDVIPLIAKNQHTVFAGAPDCESFYQETNISPSRYVIIKEGEEWKWNNINIRGIYADHGDLAPDAIGFLINIDGIKIYHAGDTCFCPEKTIASLASEVDIMIAPINGQYGNMIASETVKLAGMIKPNIIIPCHFWMFIEHMAKEGKGDPTTFLNEAQSLPHTIKPIVMCPGELLRYSKNNIK